MRAKSQLGMLVATVALLAGLVPNLAQANMVTLPRWETFADTQCTSPIYSGIFWVDPAQSCTSYEPYQDYSASLACGSGGNYTAYAGSSNCSIPSQAPTSQLFSQTYQLDKCNSHTVLSCSQYDISSLYAVYVFEDPLCALLPAPPSLFSSSASDCTMLGSYMMLATVTGATLEMKVFPAQTQGCVYVPSQQSPFPITYSVPIGNAESATCFGPVEYTYGNTVLNTYVKVTTVNLSQMFPPSVALPMSAGSRSSSGGVVSAAKSVVLALGVASLTAVVG